VTELRALLLRSGVFWRRSDLMLSRSPRLECYRRIWRTRGGGRPGRERRASSARQRSIVFLGMSPWFFSLGLCAIDELRQLLRSACPLWSAEIGAHAQSTHRSMLCSAPNPPPKIRIGSRPTRPRGRRGSRPYLLEAVRPGRAASRNCIRRAAGRPNRDRQHHAGEVRKERIRNLVQQGLHPVENVDKAARSSWG